MSTDMDNELRKHPLAQCERCPLYEVGKFVPSVGPQQAALAIVGEAPGVQEARNGVPFVGTSGKLLNAVLKHHGIDRSEVFLSNACLCRPPDNATPPKSAISACRPRLLHDLEVRHVGTVVALGNTATESILGQTGVTKLRVGPGRRSSLLPSVRVIPTIHPAACLRQSDLFPNLVTDIGKVVADHVDWTEPDYFVADSELDARQCLSGLAAGKRGEGELVIDIEVGIEKDTAYDHPNRYRMLCVGIGYAQHKVLVLGEGAMGSERVRSDLGSLLRSKRITAQNGKFDCSGLYPVVGDIPLHYDTMLMSYVLDERPGVHGLKYMAVEFLGAPQYDDEIKKYVTKQEGYAAIPRDKLYKYNATDVAATWLIKERQLAQLAALGEEGVQLRKVHDFLVAASNELKFVELNGIAIDRAYLDELSQKMGEDLESLESLMNGLIAMGDYDKHGGINPRSPMQVNAFLRDNGIKVDSTNADTIQLLIDKFSTRMPENVLEFCKLLLVHRKQAKLRGTYVEGIRKRLYRGRVYPSFLLHGTTTGRLACRNPNLQNVPRDSAIRNLFIPSRPDNVFVQTDYSQAELRVLSFLAGDDYFRGIFAGGERDLFDELTPILYPGTQKEAVSPAAWKELRIRVKAYVYGLAYGRSEFSIAKEYELPVDEARRGMRAFFDVIPEIVAFREETRQRVMDGEDLITPFGRHRRFALITKENVKDVMNEALAFLPQSTASDMCLSALIKVRQDLKGIGYVRNIIHDAILAECHEEDAEAVKKLMEQRMIESGQQVVGDYVRIAVDSKIGKSWGQV